MVDRLINSGKVNSELVFSNCTEDANIIYDTSHFSADLPTICRDLHMRYSNQILALNLATRNKIQDKA